MHVPLGQVEVPCAFVQAAAHAPQFVVVFSDASQPSVALLLQLPKLPLHTIEHAPRAQLAVPFVLLHTVPQAPQLAAVVCVFVSHPLAALLSQLPKPLLHVPSAHEPVEHDSLAFARLHTAPHPPQFARVLRSVSQPLVPIPSQSPRPGEQVEPPHTPFTQFGVPACAGQTCPHAPQLFTSVLVLVSQPSLGLPLQSLNPEAQEGTHAPPVHALVPCAFVHAVPHAPQLFTSVLVAVSQPSLGLLLQSLNPDAHVGTHAPPVQVVVPFGLKHA